MMLTLADYFSKKILPWSRYNLKRRVIVASAQMRAADMPEGVRLSRRKMTGKRVIVKNRRYYNNTRNFLALWPEDQLNEMTQLKLVGVLSGSVSFQVGEQVIHCGEGHFIIIPSGLPHPDSSRHNLPDAPGQNDCELLYLVLTQHAVHGWIDHCRRDQVKAEKREMSLFQNTHVTQLFRILMERAVEDDYQSRQYSMALLPVFFEMLSDEIRNGRYIPQGTAVPVENASLDFEQQLRRYLLSNIAKSYTVEKAAHEMYLSRAQFARRVRKETGKSFVQILNECRLEEAKVLLGKSEWTINAIAEIVGYKNPSYFRRLFHMETGMTPGEYRKQCAED